MRAMLRTLSCAALLLAGAAAAGAQDVSLPAADVLRARTFASPALDQGPLTLAEAVRLTVLFNPAVTRGTQDVEVAAGRYRETKGAFDSRVTIAPQVAYIQQPASPFMLQQHADTRTLTFSIYEAYSALTLDLRAMAEELKPRPPFCPVIGGSVLTSFQLVQPVQVGTISLDLLDDQEIRQIGAISDYAVPALPDFSSLATRANFCSLTAPPDPLAEVAAYYDMLNKVKNVNFWGSQTAGTVIESLIQIPRELAMFRAQIAETIATRARLSWEQIGRAHV